MIKVTCEKGETVEKTYFVAEDSQGGKAAVRASQILDTKLHTLANEDNDETKPKMELQPEDFIKKFEKLCPDLETFKKLAYTMAVENEAVTVTAAKESDAPVVSTEPLEKVKVDKEPTVAAEEPLVADELKSESAPETRKYFGRLPGKVTGKPEIALDLQSTLKATQEQLNAVLAENEELKKENDGMKKAGEADKVVKLLSDLGVIEDDKDKETYSKKLSGLDEKAMGIVESLLKEVLEACGDEEPSMGAPKTGAPKPAAPMGGGPKPPMGGAPKPPSAPKALEPLDSRANIVHASYDVNSGITADLGTLWAQVDRIKELSAK